MARFGTVAFLQAACSSQGAGLGESLRVQCIQCSGEFLECNIQQLRIMNKPVWKGMWNSQNAIQQ